MRFPKIYWPSKPSINRPVQLKITTRLGLGYEYRYSQAKLLNEPPPSQMLQDHRSKLRTDRERIQSDPPEIMPVTARPHRFAIIRDPGPQDVWLEPRRRMIWMKD